MRTETSARLALTNDIANALRRNELFVHYQPIVDLRTGHRVGAEALARWRHPTRGIIPPAQFIPVAEKSGMIMALGEFVLDRACTTLKAYKRKHPSDSFRMSVNLSVSQLEHPDLPRQVAAALRRHRVDPWDLVLEITESLSPVDVDSTGRRLHELKKMGVRLAIDDFGTGYSSLAYLERFPVDEIKIDRAFVGSLEANGKTDIVTSIIRLAATKKLSTVAEGVEKEKSARVLADLGCDLAQGFYFSTPVDPVDLPGMQQQMDQANGDRVGV
jgi:EAL domain-containing protein (putative c-di-GMP-specific phosphodiesterase class I)